MLKMYRIGVEISAMNGASPVLRTIARDMAGMGRQADALVGKWSKLRVAAIGAGTAMAGIAILRGMTKMVELSDKLYRNELRLRQQGMSTRGSRIVTRAAIEAAMGTPTVTAADSVAVGTKLYTTFGNRTDALRALRPSVRAEAVLDNARMGGTTSLSYDIKTAEIAGQIFKTVNGKEVLSASRYTAALDAIVKTQMVVGKMLTSASLYRATKNAGAAAHLEGSHWLPTAAEGVQQMGPTFGRGMAMIYKEFKGGMTGRTYLENLQSLGLVRAGGIKWFQGSSQGSIKSGALLGDDVLNKGGVFAWVQKVLVPDLIRHGDVTLKQQEAAIYRIFGAVTAQKVIANMDQNAPAYTRTADMIKRAPGISKTYAIQMKSFGNSVTAFDAAMNSFWSVAGTPILHKMTAVVHGITDVVVDMERMALRHPTVARMIGDGLLYLGTALTVLGSAAVIFAVGGVAAGALAALGAPAGGLAAIAAGLVAISFAIDPAIAAIKALVRWIENLSPTKILHAMLHPNMRNGAPIGGMMPPPHQSLLHSLQAIPHGPRPYPLPPTPPGLWAPPAHWREAAVPGRFGAHGPTGAAGDPIHTVTHVMNGRDIADGVTKHQAKGLQRNPSGPTGHNLRQGYLQPAYPAPGL